MEARSASRPQGGAPWLLELLAMASGGAVGACLRYGVVLLVGGLGQPAVWATFAVNGIGAFALGALLGRFDRQRSHPLLRPFWAVGVLGSFTTFSALAFDNRMLADAGGEVLAAMHLSISIGWGLLAFAAGERTTRPRSREGGA